MRVFCVVNFAFMEGDESSAFDRLQYRIQVEHQCSYILVFSYYLYGLHSGHLMVKGCIPENVDDNLKINCENLFLADKAGRKCCFFPI